MEQEKRVVETKTRSHLESITKPVDTLLSPLLTPVLDFTIKALIVVRILRRVFAWHGERASACTSFCSPSLSRLAIASCPEPPADRILTFVVLAALAAVTLVLYVILAYFPWGWFIWLIEWLLRVAGVVTLGPHMHKVGQMRDEKVAEEKKELDLQEMEWRVCVRPFR
jgi:hypothetical protein